MSHAGHERLCRAPALDRAGAGAVEDSGLGVHTAMARLRAFSLCPGTALR